VSVEFGGKYACFPQSFPSSRVGPECRPRREQETGDRRQETSIQRRQGWEKHAKAKEGNADVDERVGEHREYKRANQHDLDAFKQKRNGKLGVNCVRRRRFLIVQYYLAQTGVASIKDPKLHRWPQSLAK
jgi:hypothetical protein